MELYIMRHGQTDMNKDKLLQGRLDVKLNEEGRAQAKAAAELLASKGVEFDKVYSSHLKRAMETAMIVSGKKQGDMVLDDRIIEMEYGPYEGKEYSAFDGEMLDFIHNPAEAKAPNGVEPLEALTRRVGGFLDDIKVWSKRQTVLVMTHGVAIRAIIGYLMNLNKPDKAVWAMEIKNCSIIHVTMENGEYGELEFID